VHDSSELRKRKRNLDKTFVSLQDFLDELFIYFKIGLFDCHWVQDLLSSISSHGFSLANVVLTSFPNRDVHTNAESFRGNTKLNLEVEFEKLHELVRLHVQATECLVQAKFPDLVTAIRPKFQSTVCEDLRLALSRVSEFCPGVVLTLYGTFPGAEGKTIGSTTHRNIASRMVPHDICSVFVDLLTIVVDVIRKFDDHKGPKLYKNPKKQLTDSPLWVAAIVASKLVFQQVLRIIELSGKAAVTAVLSPDALNCLNIAKCAMPSEQFCFSVHPSSIRDETGAGQKLIRVALIQECRQLSALLRAQVSEISIAAAEIVVNADIASNHHQMQAFCTANQIKPKPKSFLYCPVGVVKKVFESVKAYANKIGKGESIARVIIGSRLWLSEDDWCEERGRICQHGRVRSSCKDCGGSGICQHGRQRSYCKDCGGSSICQHGRVRSSCKDCGGSSICQHGNRRSRCKDCGGGSICQHGKRKDKCKDCKASNQACKLI
jgi:hypothetical protein